MKINFPDLTGQKLKDDYLGFEVQATIVNDRYYFYMIGIRLIFAIAAAAATIGFYLTVRSIPYKQLNYEQRSLLWLGVALIFYNEPFALINYLLPTFVSLFYIGISRAIFSYFFFSFILVMMGRANNEGFEVETKENKWYRIILAGVYAFLELTAQFYFGLVYLNNPATKLNNRYFYAPIILGFILFFGFIIDSLIQVGIMTCRKWQNRPNRHKIFVVLTINMFLVEIFSKNQK